MTRLRKAYVEAFCKGLGATLCRLSLSDQWPLDAQGLTNLSCHRPHLQQLALRFSRGCVDHLIESLSQLKHPKAVRVVQFYAELPCTQYGLSDDTAAEYDLANRMATCGTTCFRWIGVGGKVYECVRVRQSHAKRKRDVLDGAVPTYVRLVPRAVADQVEIWSFESTSLPRVLAPCWPKTLTVKSWLIRKDIGHTLVGQRQAQTRSASASLPVRVATMSLL